jgi:DNA repair photolyase
VLAPVTLPLFPPGPPAGRPDPDAEAVRQRAGVEYFELSVRGILNRCPNPRLPFSWTINPYRGCEIGCTYCYARYTHGFFDFHRWQDFEEKIFIKRRAAEALERKLRRTDLTGQPIAIGTATDPYQPAERHFGVTRSLLEVFQQVEGLEISITTKSPLILRDMDLLTALDRQHSMTLQVSITTLDPALAKSLEPHAPSPSARLKTIRRLADEGLATSVFCMPLMPGINDGISVLQPLLTAAREAGAFEIVAEPLFLRPAARARFFPWLRDEFPELCPLYERLYRRRDYLRATDRDELLRRFRRLRLESGFPRARPGRT